MSDFLDQLEAELTRAAARQSAQPHSRSAGRRWGARLAGDALALAGRAGRMTAVGAMALVVAVVIVVAVATAQTSGRCETGGRSGGAPAQTLLTGLPLASGSARRSAVHALVADAGSAVSLDPGAARVIGLAPGIRVVLVAAHRCPAGGGTGQAAVLAAIRRAHGSAWATVDLGTAAAIRGGQALAHAAVVTIGGRRRRIAMVPSGVVRVVCRGADGRQLAFTVHRRLVMISGPDAPINCSLVYDPGARVDLTGGVMAARAQRKEQARAQRLEQERVHALAARRRRRWQLVAGMTAAVVIVVGVAVLVSVSGRGSSADGGLARGPAQRAAVTGQVSRLLNGIPQAGRALGSPSAPVTLTYYGDLECPYCAAFTAQGGLSAFIAQEVRPGHVKVVYRSSCTATCNGPGLATFTDQQVAAYAAGEQHRFWNYAELFYRQQGAEDSGYVTEPFLDKLAEEVHGMNLPAWEADRNQARLSAAVAADNQASRTAAPNGTPTLIMTGPRGRATVVGGVPSDADLQRALAKVQ